jgi:acyl dehydratase
MRMLVESVPLAGGLIGAELQLAWPKPTRPGSILRVFSEIADIRPSRSKPNMAIVTMRNETRDQDGEVLQIFTVKMPVFKRTPNQP